MLRQLIKTIVPIKHRMCHSAEGAGKAEGSFPRNTATREQRLGETLRRSLPGITYLSVQDISGGCGAMFEISVEAREFAGLSRVRQHQLVTDTLREEIRTMHGLRIHTTPTPPPTPDN